jgi:hypothetical protein
LDFDGEAFCQFFVKLGVKLALVVAKAVGSLVAWLGKLDFNDFLDAARTCRHDHYAVGERGRLGNRVSDEHDGLAITLPDLDLLLRQYASVRRVNCESEAKISKNGGPAVSIVNGKEPITHQAGG